MKTVDVLLDELGMTIEDLAESAELPTVRTEAIALGRWLPKPAERQKVARALGVNLSDISWGHTLDPRNVRYRQVGVKEEL